MKAESLIFRKLTPNEFKAITNTINSEGGGSQTYIDFPKGSISDDEFKEFFGNNGTPNTNGFEWVFYVNSLSIGRNQQREIISARRDSSNSLREQNNENRIEIWKNEKSEFPNDGYDEKNNPIIIFILKSDDGEFWSGWFYRNECTDNWPMNIGLSTMFWKDCAYIHFDSPIDFDIHDFRWPFFKQSKDVEILSSSDKPHQQIFFGAPGTGKSQAILRQTKGCNTIRTTFHPDSDYSTFVGCYKPTTDPVYDKNGHPTTEEKITYSYSEQAFLQAYLNAWKAMEEPVALHQFVELLMETRVTAAYRGTKVCALVVEFSYREADLGGTKLGPRMGVGILGLLRIPLLLGSAFLLSSGLSATSSSIGRHACYR